MSTTAEADIDQRRRNVRCLELLDASYRAYSRGLQRAYLRLADQASAAAPDTYKAVIGGILVGEVPSPETDPRGWFDYVQAQRDGLDLAVELEGRGDREEESRW